MLKEYYFSNNFNSFQNGSKEHPFSSFSYINYGKDLTRDSVLYLEKGSYFQSYLHINVSNISLSSYGEGEKPIIDSLGSGLWYQDYGVELDNPNHKREGYVYSTILLYDASNISIKAIEIRNSSKEMVIGESYSSAYKLDRTAIAACIKNSGIMNNITIDNCTIRDVYGNVYDKHMCNGGICFTVSKPDDSNTINRFENITVSNCFLKNISRWGISIGYTYMHNAFRGKEKNALAFEKYGHKNIRIVNTYCKNIGGDGITVLYSQKPIVSHCRVDNSALEMNDAIYTNSLKRMGKVAAAVWSWKCDGALFEYNEVYNTHLNQDAMAYDGDSGWDTLFTNNYSHSNDGGAVMFCLEESINSKYINNISDDDLGGVFSLSGNINGEIKNNKILKRDSVPLLRKRMDSGNAIMENNEIITIKKER